MINLPTNLPNEYYIEKKEINKACSVSIPIGVRSLIYSFLNLTFLMTHIGAISKKDRDIIQTSENMDQQICLLIDLSKGSHIRGFQLNFCVKIAREVEMVIGECYNESMMPIIDFVLNSIKDNKKKLCLSIDLTLQPLEEYAKFSEVPLGFTNLQSALKFHGDYEVNQLKLSCDTIEQLQDLIETSAMFKKSKSVRVNYVGLDDPFHNFKEYSSYDTFEACETLELEYQPPGQNVFYILKMFPNLKDVSLMMKNLSLEST